MYDLENGGIRKKMHIYNKTVNGNEKDEFIHSPAHLKNIFKTIN